jgi:hypothetical protein
VNGLQESQKDGTEDVDLVRILRNCLRSKGRGVPHEMYSVSVSGTSGSFPLGCGFEPGRNGVDIYRLRVRRLDS